MTYPNPFGTYRSRPLRPTLDEPLNLWPRRETLNEAYRRVFGTGFCSPFIVDVTAPAPVKPRKGDKVEIKVSGYVEHVYDDGSIDLVDKRTPFGDGAKDLGCYDLDEHTTLRVIESAPAAPKVGDVITSATLRETPWKRGTIVSTVGRSGDVYTSYVLTADGDWLALAPGGGRYRFDAFGPYAPLRVDHAPGK